MKTKILVVNKYHFISGGAERYFLKVMEAMRARDVEPIPLSVNYNLTLPTPYKKYFIEPVVKDGPAKIQLMKPSFFQQMAFATRAIYSWEAKKAIRDIYRDHKPDAAYFLNFNNHISPSAIDACAELGIPVVMRMSDFNLSCPSNMYYRDGHPCMDCKQGMHHALLHRCVHGSLPRTFTQVFANTLHRWMGVYQKVSAFVTPTQFMRKELLELGFTPERVHHINTFVKPCLEQSAPDREEPYILYVGRFVPYKGVETAIRAFAKIPASHGVTLKIVGDEGDAKSNYYKTLAQELAGDRIQTLPFERDSKKLHDLIHRALFTLIPSENYENLPNTILESFACGRPVIATRLGSLPGIVDEGKLGLLFEYGDCEDFAEKMHWLLEHDEAREAMGRNAREAVLHEYSEECHMTKLLKIFEPVYQEIAA